MVVMFQQHNKTQHYMASQPRRPLLEASCNTCTGQKLSIHVTSVLKCEQRALSKLMRIIKLNCPVSAHKIIISFFLNFHQACSIKYSCS